MARDDNGDMERVALITIEDLIKRHPVLGEAVIKHYRCERCGTRAPERWARVENQLTHQGCGGILQLDRRKARLATIAALGSVAAAIEGITCDAHPEDWRDAPDAHWHALRAVRRNVRDALAALDVWVPHGAPDRD